MRILRGGAWNYSSSGLRSADRNWFPPDGRTSFIGFRVARQLEPRPPDAKVSSLASREEAAFNRSEVGRAMSHKVRDQAEKYSITFLAM